jgi:hypothetical protein
MTAIPLLAKGSMERVWIDKPDFIDIFGTNY